MRIKGLEVRVVLEDHAVRALFRRSNASKRL